MGYKLVPTMKHRRRMMLSGGVYHPQINPSVVNGDPPAILGLNQQQRFQHAIALAPMIRPIDPVGRMDAASLKAFATGKDAA